MKPDPSTAEAAPRGLSAVDGVRPPHRIVLCADDYAMTDGISRAVLELAGAGKLSALSAMTTTPAWANAAAALPAARSSVAVGLHLDLTAGVPRTRAAPRRPDGRFEPLDVVIRRTFLRRWRRAALRDEIDAQLDAFEDGVGHPPDHLDGHQHAHVLPGVREALFERLLARYGERLPLVRDPSPSIPALFHGRTAVKTWLIGALSTGFARSARAIGCPVNDSFAGFSSFSDARGFAEELDGAFAQGQGLQIVMCHPGYPDADVGCWDDVIERRGSEREVLLAMAAEPRLFRPARAGGDGAVLWRADAAASA